MDVAHYVSNSKLSAIQAGSGHTDIQTVRQTDTIIFRWLEPDMPS